MNTTTAHRFIEWFTDITIDDVFVVGGKTAALGEMVESIPARRQSRAVSRTQRRAHR